MRGLMYWYPVKRNGGGSVMMVVTCFKNHPNPKLPTHARIAMTQ